MKIKADFELRDLTTAELADLYGRPQRSFREWIRQHKDKIGEKTGRWWSVNQVIIILKLRGPVKAVMSLDEDDA